jgi:cysteine dioxygenase
LISKEEQHITYQTLNELVIALSKQEKVNYNDIIHSTHLSSSAFEACCSWSEDCYTRNCIVENEKFELILLCWEKGQITPIHDHGGEECWVKIIQGEFRETIYKVDEADELHQVKSMISTAGDISYMIDFMGCHRLENLSDERSMSLHLYAKPIRNCRLFDEDAGKFIEKELEYNTVSEMMANFKK